MLLIVVKPYRQTEAGLLAVVEQTALLLFIVLCVIVKAEQLAEQERFPSDVRPAAH